MAIVFEDVTYRYGRCMALDGVSLTFGTRSIAGLIGPNGAGKTTLLSLLARRARVQQGRIHVRDEPWCFEESSVGWGTSDPVLPMRMRFDRFVEHVFGPSLGMSVADTRSHARALADALEFSQYYTLPAKRYSRGTRTKASLLLAFLEFPDIVVLDEPFSGLDVDAVDAVARLIVKHQQETHCAVIISDHRVELLEELVSEVAFISRGQLLKHGLRGECVDEFGSLRAAYRTLRAGVGV